MKHRMVRINWVDACTDHGWTPLKTAKKYKSAKVSTVGWLIGDHEDRYIVALTRDSEDANGIIAIPKGWVQEIVSLQVTGACGE